MIRLLAWLSCLLVLSISLAACSQAVLTVPAPGERTPVSRELPSRPGWETQWQRLEREAKKEGNLVVYSTTAGDVLREIFSAFQAKYGVSVDFVVGRGVAKYHIWIRSSMP